MSPNAAKPKKNTAQQRRLEVSQQSLERDVRLLARVNGLETRLAAVEAEQNRRWWQRRPGR